MLLGKLFGGGGVGGSLLTIQVNNGTDGSFTIASNATGVTMTNAANTGGGGAHNNVQPTIVCNYVIRII
jgi:microcystin-dependent protein